MKDRDKGNGPRPPSPVLTGHRDGWPWEPPMRLPTRRRLKDLAYDDSSRKAS